MPRTKRIVHEPGADSWLRCGWPAAPQGLQVREVALEQALAHLQLEHLSNTKDVDLRQWLQQQREAAASTAAGQVREGVSAAAGAAGS